MTDSPRRLCALVLFVLALASSAIAQRAEPWAVIETTAPATRAPYLLRATVPTGGEKVPRLRIGRHVCQVEPVIRRAAGDPPDVVEIVCPVQGPGPHLVEEAPRGFGGRRLRAKRRLPARVQLELRREGFRPLPAVLHWSEVLQAGAWQTVRRHWGTFDDGRGLQLGVRIFETRRATTQAVELTIEITNSVVDPDAPAFGGPVFFESLVVKAPRWAGIVPEILRSSMAQPSVEVLELVAPRPPPDLHVLPAQYSFHRRVALYPKNAPGARRDAHELLRCKGQGWATAGHSFGVLGGWGPNEQRTLLEVPKVYKRRSLAGAQAWDARTRDAVTGLELALISGEGAGGRWSSHLDANGWQHAIGQRLGWAHGGEGIEFSWSVRPSTEEFRLARLTAAMRAERQDVHASHPRDGRPITPHEWAGEDGVQPFRVKALTDRIHGVPYFRETSSSPWTKGASSYAAALAKVEHHDGQHFIRAAKEPARLVWLMADPWARERAQSNACYLWSTLPDVEVKGGGGLEERLAANDAVPFRRGELSREAGWLLYTAAIGWLAGDDEFRTDSARWLELLGMWAATTTLPNGLSMRRNESNQHWSSEPWKPRPDRETLSKSHDGAQVIEERIAKWGTLALARSGAVPNVRAILEEDLVKSTEFLAQVLVVNPWGKKGSPAFVSVADHASPDVHEKARSWYGGPEVVNANPVTFAALELTGREEFREQLFDLWALSGAKRSPAGLIEAIWRQESEHHRWLPGWANQCVDVLAGGVE